MTIVLRLAIVILILGLPRLLKADNVQVSRVYRDSLMNNEFTGSLDEEDAEYWVRLDIEITPDDFPYFLELGQWGTATVYQKGELIGQTGSMLPMSAKVYPSHRNLIPITQSGIYWAKLGVSNPLDIIRSTSEIGLLSHVQLQTESNWRLIGQSIFFGLILVMSLYNLMIYVSVKDVSYLYYVLSIVGVGLYLFFFYGFSGEFFWPECPYWDIHFFALIIPITNIARILFTKSYLHTEEYVPKWNSFLTVLIALYIIPLGLWAWSYSTGDNWLNEANTVIGILGTTVMTTITVVSVIVFLRGYKPALWFLSAYLLLNVGGILFIFRELGYLPDNFFTRYLLQYGVAAQVVLFSMGLASRLNRTRKNLSDEIIKKEKLKNEQEIEKKRIVEEQKDKLEQKVKERTLELELLVDKITSSENKLRDLNALKDRLFSIISHDLKSPLTTVDSFLNLLINHHTKLSSDEMAELSGKTKAAIQNLTLLLDNLLHWSRMQQDYMSFNPITTTLGGLIEKNHRLFRLLIEEKQLQVTIDPGIAEVKVWADKDMLDFVFRNLLHNAIKFSPNGGLIIVNSEVDGDYLNVTVEDRGVGMTQVDIDNILIYNTGFTKQGTDQERGTGIGLLMCKDFVNRNSGELTITRLNQGTRVNFSVPRLISDFVRS